MPCPKIDYSKFKLLDSGLVRHWCRLYKLVFEFAEEHGRIPVCREFVWCQDLAQWCQQQRSNKRKGKLEDYKLELLEQLPGWTWDRLIPEWDDKFGEMQTFLRVHGRYPVGSSTNPKEQLLNRWMYNQKLRYRQGSLKKGSIKKLESLPNWSWVTRIDTWETRYHDLQDYLTEHQKYPQRSYPTAHEKQLAAWHTYQKYKYSKNRLEQPHVEMLEKLPNWQWRKA